MNIHVIPTNNPSRLDFIFEIEEYRIFKNRDYSNGMTDNLAFYKHIYITTDEVPKLDEWGINIKNNVIYRDNGFTQTDYEESYCKKIIATTNLELIDYGIQAIDNEFIEWLVKNSSCDE